MRELRYPPHSLPGQTRLQWERDRLNPWRMEIKRLLLDERGWRCERCGVTGTVLDLDEGILPRCDMRGLSLEQRRLAFCEVQLFLLCPRCNRESAHDRDGAFERACARYGDQVVREWYVSLGLRAPDLRFVPK